MEETFEVHEPQSLKLIVGSERKERRSLVERGWS